MNNIQETATNTIQQRIALFIDSLGISKQRLELKLGLSNGLLGKIIKYENSFRIDLLSKMLKLYPNLSAEWLLRGEGEMLRFPNRPIDDSLEGASTEQKSSKSGKQGKSTLGEEDKKSLSKALSQVQELEKEKVELFQTIQNLSQTVQKLTQQLTTK
ncbi:MAG: hypothetical protein OHK0038_16290 [Flammeovirgaceae bacterium]